MNLEYFDMNHPSEQNHCTVVMRNGERYWLSGSRQMGRSRKRYILWAPSFQGSPDGIYGINETLQFMNLKPNDVLFDLGCGDGRILCEAVIQYGCRGVGIDIDPKMRKIARTNIRTLGLKDKIEIRKGNIFKADLSGATVCYMYLFDWVMDLVPHLNKYPGLRVITCGYHFNSISNLEDRRNPQAIDQVKRHDVRGFCREYVMPIVPPSQSSPIADKLRYARFARIKKGVRGYIPGKFWVRSVKQNEIFGLKINDEVLYFFAHELALAKKESPKSDFVGETNAVRRRCRQCGKLTPDKLQ